MIKMGCVLLASGNSSRFGENKLLMKFAGKKLIERTFEATPPTLFAKTVVVTAYSEVEKLAKAYGYEVAINHHIEQEIKHTIKIGLKYMQDMDACMFCVCDQPYICKNSVKQMAEGYKEGIYAIYYGDKQGNPVIFPQNLFGELRRLQKGQSGRDIMAKHREVVAFFKAESPMELKDIDTKKDLQALHKNLFITGKKGCGKSSVLNEALRMWGADFAGYTTHPYHINGGCAGHYIHNILSDGDLDIPISIRISKNSCVPVVQGFELVGVTALEGAMDTNRRVIVMDEIGVLEDCSIKFCQRVINCLNSKKRVIGCIKSAKGKLIDQIKGRVDTKIIELTKENKEEVLQTAVDFLRILD